VLPSDFRSGGAIGLMAKKYKVTKSPGIASCR
jgi:hypothetical protein